MTTPTIAQATLQDIDLILSFYELAIEHQKKVSHNHWDGFSRTLVESEIADNKHFKLSVDDAIGCIFVMTHTDPVIWAGRDHDAIYLHRIVTHPSFRGAAFVRDIITWARDYAKTHGRKKIRMDTWADNKKLFDYYAGFGFAHVGDVTLENPPDMPPHYSSIKLSLFEVDVLD